LKDFLAFYDATFARENVRSLEVHVFAQGSLDSNTKELNERKKNENLKVFSNNRTLQNHYELLSDNTTSIL
jgi:hypothetical protein